MGHLRGAPNVNSKKGYCCFVNLENCNVPPSKQIDTQCRGRGMDGTSCWHSA